MPTKILSDKWIPFIKRSGLKFGQRVKKAFEEADSIDSLNKITNNKGIINIFRLNFRALFNPNEYMQLALTYLQEFHAASIRMISDYQPEDSTLSREKFEDLVRREMKKLVLIELISREYLDYTTPQVTTIYKTPWCNNITNVHDYYRAQKMTWERKQKNLSSEQNAEQLFQTGKKLQEKWQSKKQIQSNNLLKKYCIICNTFEINHIKSTCPIPRWTHKEVRNIVSVGD